MMYLIVNVFLRTDTNRKIPRGDPARNVSGSCKQSDPERQKRFKGKDNFAQRSPCGLHMPKSAKKGAVETTAP
ncbi:hypothetical protein, partial [Rikenella microfusus]